MNLGGSARQSKGQARVWNRAHLMSTFVPLLRATTFKHIYVQRFSRKTLTIITAQMRLCREVFP